MSADAKKGQQAKESGSQSDTTYPKPARRGANGMNKLLRDALVADSRCPKWVLLHDADAGCYHSPGQHSQTHYVHRQAVQSGMPRQRPSEWVAQ